jgi:predicted XRE-type DNA-binding protein
MADSMEDDITVTSGSGNVFADLGVAEPEEELAKAQPASHIRAAIGRRKLTRAQAAALMGLDQPKVAALMNGRLTGFSSDRLLRCLTALGQDVDIVVRGRAKGDAHRRLRVADDAGRSRGG